MILDREEVCTVHAPTTWSARALMTSNASANLWKVLEGFADNKHHRNNDHNTANTTPVYFITSYSHDKNSFGPHCPVSAH